MNVRTLWILLALASGACGPNPSNDPSKQTTRPIRSTVFVGTERSIRVYTHEQVGDGEESRFLNRDGLRVGETPQALVANGDNLYAAVGAGVMRFKIDSGLNPTLTQLDTVPAGAKPLAMALGSALYVLNYGDGPPG